MLHDVASARVVDSLHSISNIQKAPYVGAFFVSVGWLSSSRGLGSWGRGRAGETPTRCLSVC